MINRNAAQMALALVALTGLIAVTAISFFMPEMADERMLCLGGLLLMAGSAGQYFFRINGNSK